MDVGSRRVLHRGQIDVARRLAAGAPDLQPRKAAVDRLVDGRRRVDRLAVGPHALVPAFACELDLWSFDFVVGTQGRDDIRRDNRALFRISAVDYRSPSAMAGFFVGARFKAGRLRPAMKAVPTCRRAVYLHRHPSSWRSVVTESLRTFRTRKAAGCGLSKRLLSLRGLVAGEGLEPTSQISSTKTIN